MLVEKFRTLLLNYAFAARPKMTVPRIFLCPYFEIWIGGKNRKSERITYNDEVRIFLPCGV